ncbi:unnamed protein product [Adineta steineri]|uniref:Uncharacterized protein n=1 Tax=Adineta steineri TaxID=433720 RepID=A0A819ZKW4_9BILA|nr:unnamed protein product [Adineta steineri]
MFTKKPTTHQSPVVVEDDDIKVYLDLTYGCLSSSIEQSLCIIIENIDPPLNKETEQDDENSIIDKKQDSSTEITNVAQIIQAEPMSIDPQINQKRKSDQLVDEQASDNENAPPTKKPTRPTRRKS